MNKKGFTLVELLAVVAIMGILAGIAVVGVGRYLKSSKQQAYDTIVKSAHTATTNYILNKGIQIPSSGWTIEFEELVSEKFLEDPIDPNKKDESCGGTVTVVKNNTEGAIDSYKYTVSIDCPSGHKETVDFNE
ncbi:MAG: type II secretion system protein [Firmicutes bacterium]|nr:type II secretion system protein [Bacillota bacterium]